MLLSFGCYLLRLGGGGGGGGAFFFKAFCFIDEFDSSELDEDDAVPF